MFPQSTKIQVLALIPFGVGIWYFVDGRLIISIGLWIISAALYVWDHLQQKRRKRQAKYEFISQFQSDQLRMAKQNPNLVYKILETNGSELKIQLIWAQQKPIHKGKILTVSSEAVTIFNEHVFLGMS